LADKEKFKHDTNRGSAFTNDKATKDTDPSYLGTFDNEGVAYRIVIWANEFGEDKTRLSFLIESEEEYLRKKEEREANSGGAGGAKARTTGGGGARRPAAAAAGRGRSGGGTRRNY
jgi:hypothetical protein